MADLINATSDVKEKAEACRNWRGRRLISLSAGITNGEPHTMVVEEDYSEPGVWAFEHEGEWYCPFTEKPSCAEEESRRITRTEYSAETGERKITARYYICGIKNLNMKNGERKRR